MSQPCVDGENAGPCSCIVNLFSSVELWSVTIPCDGQWIMIHLGFLQIHKIGNIANFVFQYFCSFLLYLQCKMLVNMKWDFSRCNKITFNGCRLHWPSSFLMAQVKRNWQYWNSCVVGSLWKTLHGETKWRPNFNQDLN